jgi:hypothetical protein
MHEVKQVHAIYQQCGFCVTHLLMDGQFDSLKSELSNFQVTLNIVSNIEHVPEIEQYIRTLKERTRCIYNTLPFVHIPARIIFELVYTSSFWLNSFPSSNGVSSVLSPQAIVIGSTVEYAKHCQLEFGAYVQTHEEHDNSMNARTTGAIALCPTGNTQGGYYFYSLTSGRHLNPRRWTELPMPAEIIACVPTLAHQSANNGGNGLSFGNRNGTTEAPHTAEAPHSEDNYNRYDYDAHDDAPITGVYQHEVDNDASQEMESVGGAIDEA